MKKTFTAHKTSEPGLSDIISLVTAYRSCRVLTSAVYLGVFDALSRPRSAESAAKAIGARTRPTGILLDCLAALGFLVKKNGLYYNSKVSGKFLVKRGKGGLPCNLRYQELLAPAWAELPRVVRTGAPLRSLGEILAKDGAFGAEYIKAMGDIASKPAGELARLPGLSSARRILDVGSGSGAYSRALLEQAPQARAVLLDLPAGAKAAKKILAGSPARKRMKFLIGDYNRTDFGKNEYDVILFSHITHDEGERDNLKLLANAFRALRSGGKMVIHDFMLEPDRTRPLFGALFAVHMLVYTEAGRVYTVEEYSKWLTKAGFSKPVSFEICAGSENSSKALIASKP